MTGQPSRRVALGAVGLGGALGYGVLQWLGRTYGATPAERSAPMPGDEIVDHPHDDITHAITIDTAAEEIWPWLVQVGWHRGGWYTARWVDRLLFPANAASADHIIDELQHCEVGDFIPDGPPESECGFDVVRVEPARHLVLESTTHLPRRWRTDGRARLRWTWAFQLLPLDLGSRTRFVFRWRAHVSPWWARAFTSLVIVPADAVMSHDMLHGIQQRAEWHGPSSPRRRVPGGRASASASGGVHGDGAAALADGAVDLLLHEVGVDGDGGGGAGAR